VFPDFLLPRTGDVWSELIVAHRQKIPFDGLWIVSYFVLLLKINDY